MGFTLFLLRRWDDLTHIFNFSNSFKIPKKVHSPLTTKEMKTKLKDALDSTLKAHGFIFSNERDGEMQWVRPQLHNGIAVFTIGTYTKYAPEYFNVDLRVGFHLSDIQSAIDIVCGFVTIGGKKQKYNFTGQLLHRAYLDPKRPKRRPLFPLSFTFWNTDFRQSTVDKVKDTILRYAIPYLDSIKTIEDVKNMGMMIENKAALIIYLGDAESAIKLLEEALQDQKKYNVEKQSRLNKLLNSIKTGEFQKLLNQQDSI